MAQRFNGRFSELVNQTRFASAHELQTTLEHYLKTYNHHIPQRALHHQTPVQALKDWQRKKPALFVKRVYEQSGLDNRAIPATPTAAHVISASDRDQADQLKLNSLPRYR